MLVTIEAEAVVVQEVQVAVQLEEQAMVTEALGQVEEYKILPEQVHNPIEVVPLLDQALSMV